jgi:hypothetical protein
LISFVGGLVRKSFVCVYGAGSARSIVSAASDLLTVPLSPSSMRNTKRRCITAKLGNASEQHRIGGTCQQSGEQRVFPRPRGIDLVGLAKIFAVRIWRTPSGAVCFVEPRVTHESPKPRFPCSGAE